MAISILAYFVLFADNPKFSLIYAANNAKCANSCFFKIGYYLCVLCASVVKEIFNISPNYVTLNPGYVTAFYLGYGANHKIIMIRKKRKERQ